MFLKLRLKSNKMQWGYFPFCSGSWNLYCSIDKESGASRKPRPSGESQCSCWSSGTQGTMKMALVEQGDSAPPQNCHRLVILGSAKVGKTSIVSRFLNNKFDDNYTPTIEDFHRKIYRIKGEPYRLDILDTSGNHPFPAMRRLSLLTGDLFILVYSIASRESFEEVVRLRDQIIECKGQCLRDKPRRTTTPPMVIVGNKCDREKDRVIDPSEVEKLTEGQTNCCIIETSAKKNINIEDVFLRLFNISSLPAEMSPSLHRKVHPQYVGGSTSGSGLRGVSIRRKASDACGTVAPNVRRPSIRTDLLVAQTRTGRTKSSPDETRDTKCAIQ
ncbi:GTP-binding protein Rhes-like isoform X2 [Liolophura sinensis]|uniref:GTP-binding protein Rhes-like isoform X2 n=1 Tax=Liolophura sinensis TaxID=3198878 RepID=UPI00315960D8